MGSMFGRGVVAAAFTAFACSLGAAASAEGIGTGRLFSNDLLGDGRDRWQSGSYVISKLRADEPWAGVPLAFGEMREYRLRSAIIASDGLDGAPDRSYVGALSFGVHSHFGAGTTRASIGVDVTAIGPQTGLSDLQESVHDRLGLEQVRFTDSQVDDDILFGVTAEAAELFELSPVVVVRPFGEVLLGPEDIVRVGADVFVGAAMTDDVLLRDVATGQLYPGTRSQSMAGLSFVFGADAAAVADSEYLPDSGIGAATQSRARARAGVHWRDDAWGSVFYGLTYLSPEFEDQDEGQVTGSLQLNFNF